MKFVKYIHICFITNKMLDVNVSWSFQFIWSYYWDIKKQIYIYEKYIYIYIYIFIYICVYIYVYIYTLYILYILYISHIYYILYIYTIYIIKKTIYIYMTNKKQLTLHVFAFYWILYNNKIFVKLLKSIIYP